MALARTRRRLTVGAVLVRTVWMFVVLVTLWWGVEAFAGLLLDHSDTVIKAFVAGFFTGGLIGSFLVAIVVGASTRGRS